jgi:predicted nucleotidyltransferase
MRSAMGEFANDKLLNVSSRHDSRSSYVADPNRALFESVVSLLVPVLDELVFVGGCTTGIFVTDPAAGGIRPTKDVDAIVDVTSHAQYTALSDRLRNLGLVEDNSEGAPLCRWRHGNVIVDVMPIDERVLGFSNRWYPLAIDTAQRLDIAGHSARIVTPPLFIATKLEAFHDRGGADIFASHDLGVDLSAACCSEGPPGCRQ